MPRKILASRWSSSVSASPRHSIAQTVPYPPKDYT